mmetsp:Transcript_86495/g.144374  ORF Transcript_86495/g.144374 Transcript_86495/m.144374 type:complete len:232 (-) Transcript_86495:49-744(-)
MLEGKFSAKRQLLLRFFHGLCVIQFHGLSQLVAHDMEVAALDTFVELQGIVLLHPVFVDHHPRFRDAECEVWSFRCQLLQKCLGIGGNGCVRQHKLLQPLVIDLRVLFLQQNTHDGPQSFVRQIVHQVNLHIVIILVILPPKGMQSGNSSFLLLHVSHAKAMARHSHHSPGTRAHSHIHGNAGRVRRLSFMPQEVEHNHGHHSNACTDQGGSTCRLQQCSFLMDLFSHRPR